jgi:hypothetical protein
MIGLFMLGGLGFPVRGVRAAAGMKADTFTFLKTIFRGWQMSLRWIILLLWKHGAGGFLLHLAGSACP